MTRRRLTARVRRQARDACRWRWATCREVAEALALAAELSRLRQHRRRSWGSL